MLFKNLKNQGSSNIPIGSLFSKDGAQFIIEEVDATYSRSFSKIKEKADIHSERQLIIKRLICCERDSDGEVRRVL